MVATDAFTVPAEVAGILVCIALVVGGAWKLDTTVRRILKSVRPSAPEDAPTLADDVAEAKTDARAAREEAASARSAAEALDGRMEHFIEEMRDDRARQWLVIGEIHASSKSPRR